MNERNRIVFKVLRGFQDAGVLRELILIGSWCQYFYKIYFNNAPEIPLMRTLDIDLLVPKWQALKKEIDIPGILNELGFRPVRNYPLGYVKFEHPDLELEFLVPERGRGKEGPYKIEKLGINAQGLRFLSILADYVIEISYMGIAVTLPEPAAFVLHKFIIAGRRAKRDKRERDLLAAKEIGMFILKNERQRSVLRRIFKDLPQKWQQKILESVRGEADELQELYDFLSDIQK